MTNEEKARELANTLIGDDRNIEPLVDLLLQAMQWKDEQFAQWLKENLAKETSTMFTSESQGIINFEPVIKAFEKFIKQ